MFEEDKEKHRENIKKQRIPKCVKEVKEKSELKRVEVDVVTNFIQDEVENFSDNNDNIADDSGKAKVIGFK